MIFMIGEGRAANRYGWAAPAARNAGTRKTLGPTNRFIRASTSILPYFFRRLQLTYRSAPLRRRRLRAALAGGRMLEILFAFLDLLGFFDLWGAVTNTLGWRIRPLTAGEIALLRPFFGDAIPYELVRIDEHALLGPSWGNFCYVSFFTINSWGPMADTTLVHELVHVWQYTHRGAVYIPRALAAQRSAMGYNYGGLEPLRRAAGLESFNYEQQADLIEDAFRLANGYPAQWVPGRGPEVLPYYYPFLREVLAATPHPTFG